MARVLFACYHPLEIGAIRPVIARLQSWSHETAILPLVMDNTTFPDCDGTAILRNHERTPAAAPRLSDEDYFELLCAVNGPATKPVIREDELDRLIGLIAALHSTLKACFPLQLQHWIPPWRSFVNEVFELWQPDVVVLSLGQIETPLVRTICERTATPCLYLLAPFFEFKTIERLYLVPELLEIDEYCVASEVGKQRLLQESVPEHCISVTGAPQFDWILNLIRSRDAASPPTILYTHQRIAENVRLGVLLLEHVVKRPGIQLLIRPHPTMSDAERTALQNQINSSPVRERVRLSPPGSPLADDLACAAVVVSVSSMTLFEATLAGVPAVCWHPSFLPPEIALSEKYPIQIARSRQELEASLDQILANFRDDAASETLSRVGSPVEKTESATDRVCNRILARVPIRDANHAAGR